MAAIEFSKPSPLILAAAVPALPDLFGLTGAGVGIYGFVSPNQAARLSGLHAPTTDRVSPSSHAEAFQRSLSHTYGIRNVGTGLATLGLVSFWQLSTICHENPIAALVARKCLGICFLTGSIVGLGDAWIIGQFAKDDAVSGDAESEASKASVNHGITAVFILATGLLLLL